MTHDASLRTETISPADRYLPLLALLFIGSGCAALIYEPSWRQQAPARSPLGRNRGILDAEHR